MYGCLMMFLNVFQTVICIFSVKVVAFIDFGNGEEALEMVEEGKNQYKLLEERGRLPRYGECWKAALEHVHEGCRYLSEDTQSDIALHITNCFLAMSGHEVYHCELDKKPNLRGICISSMTDRAFNVYTEFYTHTQSICWFLRGQVWQEKITENTMQVGKQLDNSLKGQEILLQQQQESLSLQQQLLKYGHSLERVLNESRHQAAQAMEEIRLSAQQHQRLLTLTANSLAGLQSWLIGEISWFDSLVFYIGATFMTMALTSSARTAAARLPLLLVLSLNVLLERAFCSNFNDSSETPVHLLHETMHKYVWWCRRITCFICALILLVLMYTYRDYAAINNALLLDIQEQNQLIRSALEKRDRGVLKDRVSVSVERECNGVDSTSFSPRIVPIVPHCTPRQNTPKYNLRTRNTPLKQTFTPEKRNQI